jgi:sulfate transport system permease protein
MTTAEAHLATILPAQAERIRRRAMSVSPRAIRISLIAIAAGFLGIIIVLPLAAVLLEAFRSGLPLFLAALAEPDALAAFRLTALTAAIVLPLNILFGVAAAWSIAKFDWPGKTLVTTLIDLPFTVSPVVAGMAFVLLFGARGWLGPSLDSMGVKIIFAVPGVILATAFVTVPFIARELIPLMESQSRQEEEAALSLGASGWKTFFRITLPNIKWGLIYGSILCAARAVGEFGAVSVVSGHIRGQTETVPLHVEALYGEYKFGAASALATLLIAFTLLTVLVRHFLQSRHPSVLRSRVGH